MNIVQMILNLLGGDFFGKLGGLLGLSSDRTASAAKAAVPALLGVLASQASTPEGARRIASAVNDADDGILSNLGGAFDQRGRSWAETGSSLLGSLLPSNTLSSLTSVLSKFTGIGSSMVTPLLGSLAPVILGFLKRQTKGFGSDASGIANLLADQKENIVSALPSGLANMLGDIPGLSSLTEAGRAVAGTVEPVRSSPTARRTGEYAAAAARPASISPLMWILPLLALLALGWWAVKSFLPDREKEKVVVRQTDDTRETQRTVVKKPVDDDVAIPAPSLKRPADLEAGFTTAFTSITDTLGNIEDADSAQAAVPKLRQILTTLDGLKEPLAALPAAQRTAVTRVVESSHEKLLPLIEKLYAIPGVRPILKPLIDQLLARIDEFTAAPVK
jgi:hypothetical protein